MNNSIFFFTLHILTQMKKEKIKKDKKSKKGLFWMLGVSGLAVSMLLFCQFYFADTTSQERFFENTTINGIDVSYLTTEEAENIIEYNLLKDREKISCIAR